MTLPSRKVIFLWRGTNFGTPDQVAEYAARLGLSAVSLKVANGNLLYPDLMPYVSALRAKGIRVGGWHYLYSGVKFPGSGSDFILTGITPEQEAGVSLDAIRFYNLDFFEIDAEREYKVWNQANRAARYMRVLKPAAPVPVGLTSYRFPDLHREFPFKEFATEAGGVDYVVPQVYWQPETSPNRGAFPETVESFSEYVKLWKSFGRTLDASIFIPAGRAYVGDGYPNPGPPPAEIIEFLETAKIGLGFPGASFWAFEFLKLHLGGPERGETIARFEWPAENPPPEPEPEPEARWVQVVTTGSFVYLRPQPAAGSGLPSSGQTYNGKKFQVLERIVNEAGEPWLKVSVYVAEWLTRPTTPP